ncbi:DEAD/DEAH box helicase family protein [Stenotrophomonas sp. JAI102]|uniref:DEAD/DEAH box helicase n=1 Tax=Stenotrophomonas sp. JAI102 TaxID=2723077 RepID=UPI0015CE1A97|nr:DEAD/DEAH box helicase family protein [Stenotrophomonas sp. JAI102]NYF37690.1 superfamily II DNA or RNA helicase [Stenotrophomonas sp. JAI102]
MLSTDEIAEVTRSMRQGQRESFEAVRRYLAQDHFGSAFLAVMPTGAGKSGLIATLCQAHESGPVLVLSPRAAVCRQLATEIAGKFFSDRGVAVESLRQVDGLSGELKNGCIYVATFQKLIRMEAEALAHLASTCSLLIVDEGHSEPAPLWGKAVRAFACHKIIVTATPYRNDLFQFDIGADANYCYTFKKAIEHAVIELPDFEQCTLAEAIAHAGKFLDEHPSAKAIVKTKNLDELKRAKRLLDDAGLESLAIHERLKDDPIAGTSRSVPSDLQSQEVRVVVHQRKLDEGVDLPSAKLCILTYPVASGRELVQTVGRIVRKFEGIQPLVLDCSSSSNAKLWKNYLEFDSYISTDSGWNKFVNSLDTAKLIESYLESFPSYTYLGSSFREKFELSTLQVDQDIRVPIASVCFLGVEEDFTIEAFVDAMMWRHHQSGELARPYDSAHGFKVIASIRFESSKYLRSKLLFEPSLEIVIAKRVGEYLALFDSRSINHAGDAGLGTKQPVDSKQLFNLSARGAFTRVKETHARSISSTRKRPERVSHIGQELTPSISGQSAASYALSVTKVDNLDATSSVESSYYLSAGSGRVSDQRASALSLEALCDWVAEVVEVLEQNPLPLSPVIGAFALPIDPQSVTGPLSLTIDFTDLPPGAKAVLGAKSFAIDSTFVFLECPDWTFKIGTVELKFEYSEPERRIKFTSDAGAEMVFPDGTVRSLDEDIRTTRQTFDPDSVFSFVDNIAHGRDERFSSIEYAVIRKLIPDVDLVLCTDMGTEAADFVITSPKALCFVHIKCGKSLRPNSPAGALAEVGSQAIKNIEYLVSSDEKLPFGNEGILGSPWPSKNATYQLDHRIRFMAKDGIERSIPSTKKAYSTRVEQALATIKARRRSLGCRKEVWIVAGNSFSYGSFKKEMAKGANAKAESLQAYQLIDAWLAVSSANDVDLRIIVSP